MAPLWQIGPDELVDTYKQPELLGDVVARPGEQWPDYHPSEADPEAGYREHPYSIVFDLDEPEPCELRIEYLVIAPRVPSLRLEVNGVEGHAYLHPTPSTSGEIRLQAGLHTTLYCDGELRVARPAGLLRAGENRLVLTPRDDGEVLRVENPEAVKRLDRMANAAGLVYRRLSLEPARTPSCARRSTRPSSTGAAAASSASCTSSCPGRSRRASSCSRCRSSG
ncbi:MAG: hypothetical protein ACXVZL_03640 [Gaiellaceae bacterium]